MTPRRIIIEEVGKPQPAAVPVQGPKVELQDWLYIGGIVLGEAAALVIWWPAALILGCLFCLVFACMIDRTKAQQEKSRKNIGTV